MRHAHLLPHPTTPDLGIHGIDVRLDRLADALLLTYTLTGDLARLRIPAPGLPRRVDGLWRHTCFEAFVRVEGERGYREFNFSPSGEWAAYAFADYRKGDSLDLTVPPLIECRACEIALELTVRLPDPACPDAPRLRLALATVIEDRQDRLAYWALCHTSYQPDFHHPDAFTLGLDTP